MAKGISLHIGLNSVDPNHYAGWSGELRACENDARDMKSIAESKGFEPGLLLTRNAKRDLVLEEVDRVSKELKGGDIFLLTYSGHGGQVPDHNFDEDDGQDETWCLYDGQLIDDEIKALWLKFRGNVRVLVISDSCHSGTIIRAPEAEREVYNDFTPKLMPDDVSYSTYMENREWYDRTIDGIGPIESRMETESSIKATVRLISGCQDNQNDDGTFNGQFTGRLKRVWNGGQFRGNYNRFHKQILSLLPAYQSPNHLVIGKPNKAYDREKPFEI